MSKVYTIASGKGGTGKTTVVANLGPSLAMLGKKVTILDADIGMANLGLILGVGEDGKVTLHEVLAGNADISKAIHKGPAGINVIPSGISLQGFKDADPERLKDVMAKLANGCDFLLIDAPAGISKDALIPLSVADEVILVLNPELPSLADGLKTKVLTEMVGRNVKGVILNKVGMEKTEPTAQKVKEFMGTKIIGIVPNDANVRRAAVYKTPVVIRNPKSPASVAFKKIAARLAGEKFEEEEELERKESFVDRLAKTLFGGKR
ncbi:MAG: cell division ATPase MinD [Candidatus Syntropharchaeia archaeon]